MAKQIHNNKGFMVLETTRAEIISINPNNLGICDSCSKTDSHTGFYVGVLNWWMCPECYEKWYLRAIRYTDDIEFERKHFLAVCAALFIVFSDD